MKSCYQLPTTEVIRVASLVNGRRWNARAAAAMAIPPASAIVPSAGSRNHNGGGECSLA